MRKIKKALALSLAMAMGLSLVACGGNDDATTEAKTEAKTHRSSDLIFLLKGVDFIMMISVKDICFGSLLVHSVFLPVPHVSLPHSA